MNVVKNVNLSGPSDDLDAHGRKTNRPKPIRRGQEDNYSSYFGVQIAIPLKPQP